MRNNCFVFPVFFFSRNVGNSIKLHGEKTLHGARTCKVLRKYINAFLSYSAKTKRDGQTDGRTDGRTDRRTDGQTDRQTDRCGGVAISPVPGLWRRGR